MSTDFMVLSFSDTGEVSALHRDEFDIGFLGKQEIKRASEILFNELSQKWAVHLPDHDGNYGLPPIRAAKGFVTYKQARDFEVEWLEHCALQGVEPISLMGIAIANTLRGNPPN